MGSQLCYGIHSSYNVLYSVIAYFAILTVTKQISLKQSESTPVSTEVVGTLRIVLISVREINNPLLDWNLKPAMLG